MKNYKVIHVTLMFRDVILKDTRVCDPVSILYKSLAGRYRPVRVADGPITARYRFIKNNGWGMSIDILSRGNIYQYQCNNPFII